MTVHSQRPLGGAEAVVAASAATAATATTATATTLQESVRGGGGGQMRGGADRAWTAARERRARCGGGR